MCKVLQVSRSSYYRWLKEPEGKRKRNYMELDKKIEEAYFAAKGRNGSPRLAKDLQASGTPVSILSKTNMLFLLYLTQQTSESRS